MRRLRGARLAWCYCCWRVAGSPRCLATAWPGESSSALACTAATQSAYCMSTAVWALAGDGTDLSPTLSSASQIVSGDPVTPVAPTSEVGIAADEAAVVEAGIASTSLLAALTDRAGGDREAMEASFPSTPPLGISSILRRSGWG